MPCNASSRFYLARNTKFMKMKKVSKTEQNDVVMTELIKTKKCPKTENDVVISVYYFEKYISLLSIDWSRIYNI